MLRRTQDMKSRRFLMKLTSNAPSCPILSRSALASFPIRNPRQTCRSEADVKKSSDRLPTPAAKPLGYPKTSNRCNRNLQENMSKSWYNSREWKKLWGV